MRTRATPWGRVETCHSVSLRKAAGPPRFGGGSLSSFSLSRVRSDPRRFKAANHSGMRHIEEGGFAAFLARMNVTPPPSERVTLRIGHCDIKKQPILRLSQPPSSRSANRTAGLVGNELASLKRETRFAAGFPIAFHRNKR